VSYSINPESTKEHPLSVAARRHSSYPALRTGNTSLTYESLHSQSERLAFALFNRGIQSGQIVALGDLPAREMIISLWGCMLGGFIAFPLNVRFPSTSLAQILDDMSPALIISDSSYPGHETVPFSDLNMADNQVSMANLPVFDCSAAASLLMTSGSSGDVKFVQHSHHNHIESARGSNQNIQLTSSNSWLLSLPLYHVGGLSILFRCALAGATIIIQEAQQSTLRVIDEQGVTHISLVATQLQRLLKDESGLGILQEMKAILIGGSAITPALIHQALDHKLPILVSYGSTEMASQITTTTGENRDAALQNSGRLLTGRDLIISQEGEILVKGDTLAQGYLQHSKLVDLRDENGWFHTGDVGYTNVHGELTITGRMDNQFISGGENVQPEHIERVLCKIPGILNAIIIPQADEEFGARPVAFLEIMEDAPDGKEIMQQLRSHLPGYMLPVAYFAFPDVLIENSFKISRTELTKLLQTENKHLHPL